MSSSCKRFITRIWNNLLLVSFLPGPKSKLQSCSLSPATTRALMTKTELLDMRNRKTFVNKEKATMARLDLPLAKLFASFISANECALLWFSLSDALILKLPI